MKQRSAQDIAEIFLATAWTFNETVMDEEWSVKTGRQMPESDSGLGSSIQPLSAGSINDLATAQRAQTPKEFPTPGHL